MHQSLTIIGNLGKDPEMRYLPSGSAVTNFSVATSRTWKVDDEKKEETVWFRVAVWGKQAETCNKYLKKGSKVFCDGRLTIDQETGGPRVWEDGDGNWRASYEMSAFKVLFLSPNGTNNESGEQNGSSQTLEEQEIPF